MRLILSILVLLTNIKCNKKDTIDDMKTDISNDKQKKEIDSLLFAQNIDKDTYNKVIFLVEKEWVKIYGNKIYDKKPFIIKIKNDSIWSVEGTLPEDFYGGVPYAEINIKTFEISNITHGK